MKTQGSHKDVVFLSGVRTGFGGFGGSLKDLSAIELGAVAAQHALERSGVPAADVGHTVFGNALQTSADAINCARHVGLKRSEEHTSELQSQSNLVCRLLLEKKKKSQVYDIDTYMYCHAI